MYKCVADNVLNTRVGVCVYHFLDSQLRMSGVDISTFLLHTFLFENCFVDRDKKKLIVTVVTLALRVLILS